VKGLVALWREALLAQKVLLGETKGYKNHPQLSRFKATENSLGAIASYLSCVNEEAKKRGYHFDSNKIIAKTISSQLLVTHGQVEYEFKHLLSKLQVRDGKLYEKFKLTENIKLHPLFEMKDGGIEAWEIIK
jgi:hypothetical protein